jgi:Zn-dependent metalloprotease
MTHLGRPVAHIVPPYLLRHLATTTEPIAEFAKATLTKDQQYRHSRATGSNADGHRSAMATPASAAAPFRRISDAGNAEQLPGKTVRDEGAPATGDVAVDEAYDGFGATWKLYEEVYGRNSIDGAGLRLLGTVHYGEDYQNAFWNGTRMVFGDGDGEIFGRFTASLDVIGHELTHGVVEHTAALAYSGQSGALNESIADVFGVLVKQYALSQDAAAADWLIGGDLLLPGVKGVALRSMVHPGTAYDDPRLGKDPQPDNMSGFVKTTDDNGGVHYNSGIPNRAFALAATAIGGPAWEKAGRVWYDVLTGGALAADADFADFAQLTIAAAATRFGADSPEAAGVRDGWTTVGVGADANAPAPTGTRLPVDQQAELLLRRTGGFAGIPRERQAKLSDLPADDRRTWQGLLADDLLPRLAAESSPRPDAFAYCVTCVAVELDVEVSEPDLPERLRRLFERTLSGE